MKLIETSDGKIIIQSLCDGRNLQVQGSGLCVFANRNQELWEKFDVERDEFGKIYFISCHTGNVLQCDEHGFARCVNKNRLEWEAWTIVYPHSPSIMTRLNTLVATGAALFPIIGLAAGAIVPLAMSTFGTVVAGVGTFHAPLTSFGCAAILQASSATLASIGGSAAGAIAGATVGAISLKNLLSSSFSAATGGIALPVQQLVLHVDLKKSHQQNEKIVTYTL